MDVSDARKLKALEDENAKLKKLQAETMLDNAILKDGTANEVSATGDDLWSSLLLLGNRGAMTADETKAPQIPKYSDPYRPRQGADKQRNSELGQ